MNFLKIVVMSITLNLLLVPLIATAQKNTGAWIYNLKDKDDINVRLTLENSFRVKFPSNMIIKNVSLVGGKDWILYAKFQTENNQLDFFKNNIRFKYKLVEKDKRIFKTDYKNIHLPWWFVDETKVNFIIEDPHSFAKMIIVRENDKDVSIFLYTDGGRTRFPGELWDIFDKYGYLYQKGAFWITK
jgi:hypothetical protein